MDSVTSSKDTFKLSVVLKNISQSLSVKDRITIFELKSSLQHYGVLLLTILFSIPSMLPVPGISTLTGIPLILLSIQVISGAKYPWLPKSLNDKAVPTMDLVNALNKVVPYVQKFEIIIKPRLLELSSIRGTKLIGIFMLIFSVTITLPVVFGNTLPSIGIMTMAFGLLNRDGLIIIAGILIGLTGVTLATAFVFFGYQAVVFMLKNII